MYDVKGHQNVLPTRVWDQVYDLRNDTLEFQTPVKELTGQDAVNDQNPVTNKVCMMPQQRCIIIVTKFHMIMLVGSCSLQVELMS